jgi:transposase-like protein
MENCNTGQARGKVIEVLQKLVGADIAISSTQISRCTATFDEGMGKWRNRPLGITPYLVLDARYERVRHAGQVIDCAVLIAIGITETGHRRVLGVSVELSEAEVHWRSLIESLLARGMTGVKYIVSDDHAGLRAARKSTLPSVPWQRCQFHLQHNAQGYVTKLDDRVPVARAIRAVFNAPDASEAARLLKQSVAEWQKTHPKLATWAETNLEEGFAVYGLPVGHRVRMRTTNGLERLNQELKRRTRVATLFPNPASCLRLVSAMLAEQDEEWMTAKSYLTMTGWPASAKNLMRIYRRSVALSTLSQCFTADRARACGMHPQISTIESPTRPTLVTPGESRFLNR